MARRGRRKASDVFAFRGMEEGVAKRCAINGRSQLPDKIRGGKARRGEDGGRLSGEILENGR